MIYPKVSIIVLNWNGWKDTLECLDSLTKINYPNYEVIVVDNGSTNESVSQLRIKNQELRKMDRGFILIENKENLGFAEGNNVGIKRALENGANYILLLNNDTAVDKNFLGELIKVGETNPKTGILGPKIYYWQEPKRIWFGGGALKWIPPRGYHLDYNREDTSSKEERIKIVDYCTGCALMIKKEVIEKIGLMSEDYFLYYEDTDWCLRAKKAGYLSYYVPEAKIYHKISRSAKVGSPSYIYYHTRNGLVLVRRNGPFWAKILLYPYTLYLITKQFIKLFIPSKRMWAKAVLEGIKDFYLGKMERYKKRDHQNDSTSS